MQSILRASLRVGLLRTAFPELGTQPGSSRCARNVARSCSGSRGRLPESGADVHTAASDSRVLHRCGLSPDRSQVSRMCACVAFGGVNDARGTQHSVDHAVKREKKSRRHVTPASILYFRVILLSVLSTTAPSRERERISIQPGFTSLQLISPFT